MSDSDKLFGGYLPFEYNNSPSKLKKSNLLPRLFIEEVINVFSEIQT
jgi:hypothetical protein